MVKVYDFQAKRGNERSVAIWAGIHTPFLFFVVLDMSRTTKTPGIDLKDVVALDLFRDHVAVGQRKAAELFKLTKIRKMVTRRSGLL